MRSGFSPGLALSPLLLLLIVPWSALGDSEGPSEEQRSAEEWLGLREGGLTQEERNLLQRPDEKRPTDQFTTDLLGRRLTIGWFYELRGVVLENIPFKDKRVDDLSRTSQRLSIDFFYRLTESASLFLRGNAFYRSRWKRFDDHPLGLEDDRDRERGIERDEMWVFLREVANTPFSLQIGRQRLSEDREWWWDDDLDAIRLHYDLPNLHLEVAISHLLGRISTEEPHIDPEEEDVIRFLARGDWAWTRRNRLHFFLLHQRDRSETDPVGLTVKSSREDESDGDLWWVGASARGRFGFTSAGRLEYWADTALVDGRETSLDYTGMLTDRRVRSRTRHGVHGWAVDVGVTWEIPLPRRPALTLSYAVGSGDRSGKDKPKRDDQRATDRSFRQTGLEDNNGRFRGVDRFKYYGELLDPELSNLRIGTVALGVRFWKRSSVEVLYHFYRQDQPAKFLRDADIRRQPAGRKRGIGHEIDLVVGIEEWQHVELELIGAAFRAGPAFEAHCDDEDQCLDKGTLNRNDKNFVPSAEGEWSYLAMAKFKLNF